MNVRLLAAVGGLCVISNVQALTLDQSLDEAIGYDKKYAAAIYEARSAEYLPTVARAALLPKLTISGFQANNNLTQTAPNLFGGTSTTAQNYTAKSYSGQLTQPLFNLAAIATYLQSKKQEGAAQQKLSIDLNELKVRVIDAYCTLASAKKVYLSTARELKTLGEQEKIINAKRLAGAASGMDLEEITYSKLQTQAILDDANNILLQAKIDLEILIGRSILPTEALELPVAYLPPEKKLNELIEIAKNSNPKILFQQSNYQSAVYQNNSHQSMHAPTVDIVGYQGYQTSNTLSTVGQKSIQGYLGLQMNIPISTGGETYGKVMQSRFYAESQRLLVDSEVNEVEASVRKLYSQVKIGAEKLTTLKSQIWAADQLYHSFLTQREMGLKSTYDLLIATRRKFQSERELDKTQYERVQSLKRLEVIVGDDFSAPTWNTDPR